MTCAVSLWRNEKHCSSVSCRQSAVIRYSEHFAVPGTEFIAEVCNLGLEGMISKLRDSTYQGTRGNAWLKIKCGRQQEFVIGGFTDPEGSRHGFGALLLGVYDAEGSLRYSGKVGTGFNESLLAKLRKTLDGLVQDKSRLHKSTARGRSSTRPLGKAGAGRPDCLHGLDSG